MRRLLIRLGTRHYSLHAWTFTMCIYQIWKHFLLTSCTSSYKCMYMSSLILFLFIFALKTWTIIESFFFQYLYSCYILFAVCTSTLVTWSFSLHAYTYMEECMYICTYVRIMEIICLWNLMCHSTSIFLTVISLILPVLFGGTEDWWTLVCVPNCYRQHIRNVIWWLISQ